MANSAPAPKKYQTCNVCKKTATIYENVDGCRLGQYVLKKSVFKTPQFTAALYHCPNCYHFFMHGIENNNFYDGEYSEWQGALGYYGQLKNSAEVKIEKIHHYLNLKNSIGFFDIGCGVGGHLDIAKKYFSKTFGIEPSDNAKIARKKGHDVISGYFDENIKITRKFDAFSSFQVLEHVKDPVKFMSALFDKLEEGGVGLINVPDGRSIMENARYDQIISEHENYFTSDSILFLAKQAGFEVLELNVDNDALEIDLYIAKRKKQTNKQTNYISEKKSKDAEKLRSKIMNGKKIGIWGAGQKTVSFSTLLPDGTKISHFFDNDKSKEGYFVSGISIPIEVPTKEKVQACELIIIFASSYASEITVDLKNNYNFSGEVVTIDI